MLFARWALSASALGVIGAFGATLLTFPGDPQVIRIRRIAQRAAVAMILSCFLIITAQLYDWFGIEGLTDPANVWTMLSITLWGLHWSWLAAVAVGTAIALTIAAKVPRSWIYTSGAAALAAAAYVPLIGHGGSHDALTTFLHRAHLFGAGLWIGSLGVTVLAGIGDPPALLTTLRRFAPIALTGAAIVAVTGLILAWEHLKPLSLLWTSDYGQTLMAKLAAVVIVGGLGFINWRGPRLRVVITEITIAVVVVLSLTALLSGLEPPSGGH